MQRTTLFAATLSALVASSAACSDGPTFDVATTDDSGADETLADAPRSDDAGADAVPEADAHGDADARSDTPTSLDAPCETPVFCYVDADDDTFVVSAGAFAACGACPSGSRAIDPTSAAFDCDDFDPTVHPGATAFETTPYCVPGSSCAKKSFDYDCDGVETAEWSAIGSACVVDGSGCSGDGWIGGAVAACGDSVGWLACTRDLLACKPSTAPRVQGCR